MSRDHNVKLNLGTRWLWAKSLDSPDHVTENHIKVVYRLDKPVCPLGHCESTCKSSPLCLNGLGQLKLIDLVRDSDGSEKLNSEQSIDQPFRNGLKNYGSTCYLNAFLQLYFRFGKLREAIYSLPSENDETGIIHQLQVIFSQLQLNDSGVVDPGGLIEALRLCEEEQQDAPEFHCLFMNLLEARFREFGLSTVDDLFRGETVYETRCLNCGFTSRQPSKFLELSLKVSSTSLVGCITDYLKEEPLAGENRYACPRCGGKQDGIRRVYITRAPSLLCIQLLRFTYDPRTGQRKKQKATIRLPDTLELTELHGATSPIHSEHSVACLVPQFGTPCPRTYRLCGVLLHIGTQPTSGHYIAVVRDSGSARSTQATVSQTTPTSDANESDSATDFWTVCNDIDVCSIPADKFNLTKANGSAKALQTCVNANSSLSLEDSSKEYTTSPKSLGKRSKKPPKNRTKKSRQETEQMGFLASSLSAGEPLLSDSSGPGLLESKPTVRWHASPNAYMIFYQSMEDSQSSSTIHVPDHLRQMVEEVNLFTHQAMQDQLAFQTNRREQLEHLVSELWPPDPACLSEISLVPTRWLAHWFDHPEQPPPQLRPCRGSTSCSASVDPPDRGHSPAKTKPNSELSVVTSSNAPSSPVFYSFPVCPHNRIPDDADAYLFRAVSRTGLQRLLERWPEEWASTNLEFLQPCRICVRLKVALIHLKRSIQELSKSMDAYLRSQSGLTIPPSDCALGKSDDGTDADANAEPNYYWIGRRSLIQWRVLAREYVKALYSRSENDQSCPSCVTSSKAPPTRFNADVLCPHGKLRTNSKSLRCLSSALWIRLVALFPGAAIPTFPVLPYAARETCVPSSYRCAECESLEVSLVQRAMRERQLLPNLVTPAARRLAMPLTTSGPGPVTADSDEARVRELLVDCFSPRKPSAPQLTITHSAQPLSEHGQVSSSPQLTVTLSTADRKAADPLAVYLVPMDFIDRWRRFIRNPGPDTVPQYLPSGLNGRHVLCAHDELSMPWWNLVSDAVLCPLTAQEWCTLSQFYPPLNVSTAPDCCKLDDSQDDDPDEDAAVDDTILNAHITTPYPPIYLVPSSTGKPDWYLCPSRYAQVCISCHKKILSERNSYQNARFRVRLVRSADEALNDGVECTGSGQHPVEEQPQEDEASVLSSVPSLVTTEPQSPGDQGTNKIASSEAETTIANDRSSNGTARLICDTNSRPSEPDVVPESASSPHSSQLSTGSSGSTKLSTARTKPARKRRSPVAPPQAFVRRSTRQRVHPNDLVVQGSSDQPLQHIKLQLMQLLGVTPSDQHLMLKGVELSDHTKTLQELGIHADSLLYLWTDGPIWNLNGGTDSDNSQSFKRTTGAPKAAPSPKLPSSYKSNNTVPVELGFKGTRLLEN